MKYINLNKLEDNSEYIEITSNGKIYELHNDSDFISFIYNLQKKEIILNWKYPSSEFYDKSIFRKDDSYLKEHDISLNSYLISLKFSQVNYLQFTPRDTEYPFTEDLCLDCISTSDKHEKNKITFRFQSESSIIIEAESVIFVRDTKFKFGK
jgi:hypothetical protein